MRDIFLRYAHCPQNSPLNVIALGRSCRSGTRMISEGVRFDQITVLTLRIHITKTCLYNFGPLKPHFYISKLGFTGVNIIFLISAQNIHCGYSLEPPRVPTVYVLSRNMKNKKKKKYLKIFIFGGKIFNIFE